MSHFEEIFDEWDYEFDIHIATVSGNYYSYGIEADSLDDAMKVAEEFFTNDYPDEEIEEMWWVEEDD